MEHEFKFYIESPFNPLTLRLRRETVLFRLKVMKEVFIKVENLHREEYETLVEKDNLEYKTTQDEEGNYNDIFLDKIRELDHFFYRNHRVSTTLTLYAMLESSMMKICHSKQKEYKSRFSVTDLSDSGIARCKKYLSILGVVDFSEEPRKSYWDRISFLGSLRNFFAHAEGDLDSTFYMKSKTINAIKKGDINGLYFEDGNTLMLTDTFVLSAFDHVEAALIDLCEN
ncbi:TPA: hypothetical protein I7285_03120 [Vibrio parahaemolyticus]|nr:hypothetical protein [Vibrio parahaemolyticus]HAS6904137.1 hypothetical protein [Vibrio parahaemolyticus]